MTQTVDPFFEPYDRAEIAYGDVPSAALSAYLGQVETPPNGQALDLGAGAGRDTLALACAGYSVTSVDLSSRGMQRIVERANQAGVGTRVVPTVADVREFGYEVERYDAIVATTVLDHVPANDAEVLWRRIVNALAPRGFLFVEVHSTSDPGSPSLPGSASEAPVSETASAVINYFAPNQLVEWALRSSLRILSYEERLEWDYTHGPEHMHGKAVLLAVRNDFHPDWYGAPAAFPRRES